MQFPSKLTVVLLSIPSEATATRFIMPGSVPVVLSVVVLPEAPGVRLGVEGPAARSVDTEQFVCFPGC